MSRIIGGSAFGNSDALIDTTDAVLLDETNVAILGSIGKMGVETVIALELEGRVNRTTDRHDALYLLNADGAAGIISELLGIAGRADPAFLQVLLDRIDQLPRQR